MSSFSVSVTSEHSEADYLQLDLDAGQNPDSSNAPPKLSSSFMTLDLRQVLTSLSESGKDVGMVGKFVGNLLSFVKGHLISKPLVMAVAAAAEQEGHGNAEGIQEGFLMLCEVRHIGQSLFQSLQLM